MTKQDVVNGYMMNEKHVIAEMLYDTIARYEQRIAELESPKTCDGCKHEFIYGYLRDGTHICTMCSRNDELKDYYEPKDK